MCQVTGFVANQLYKQPLIYVRCGNDRIVCHDEEVSPGTYRAAQRHRADLEVDKYVVADQKQARDNNSSADINCLFYEIAATSCLIATCEMNNLQLHIWLV